VLKFDGINSKIIMNFGKASNISKSSGSN